MILYFKDDLGPLPQDPGITFLPNGKILIDSKIEITDVKMIEGIQIVEWRKK